MPEKILNRTALSETHRSNLSLGLTSIDEALETAAMAMRAGVDWLGAGTPTIADLKTMMEDIMKQR